MDSEHVSNIDIARRRIGQSEPNLRAIPDHDLCVKGSDLLRTTQALHRIQSKEKQSSTKSICIDDQVYFDSISSMIRPCDNQNPTPKSFGLEIRH